MRAARDRTASAPSGRSGGCRTVLGLDRRMALPGRRPRWRVHTPRPGAQDARETFNGRLRLAADPILGIVRSRTDKERRDEDCVSGSRQHGIGDGEPPSRRGTSPGRLEPHSGKSRAARERGRGIGGSSGSGGRRMRNRHDQPHGRCVDQKDVRCLRPGLRRASSRRNPSLRDNHFASLRGMAREHAKGARRLLRQRAGSRAARCGQGRQARAIPVRRPGGDRADRADLPRLRANGSC